MSRTARPGKSEMRKGGAPAKKIKNIQKKEERRWRTDLLLLLLQSTSTSIYLVRTHQCYVSRLTSTKLTTLGTYYYYIARDKAAGSTVEPS